MILFKLHFLGRFWRKHGRGYHTGVKGSVVSKTKQKACPLDRPFEPTVIQGHH